jgi:hypothetical protein
VNRTDRLYALVDELRAVAPRFDRIASARLTDEPTDDGREPAPDYLPELRRLSLME